MEKEEIVKNLVIKAVKYAKKVGKKRALDEFNNSKGRFTKDEFYIFAISMDGVVLANYSNKKLIGIKAYSNKKHFISKSIQIVKKKRAGWIKYYWKHPISKKIMKKSSYIMGVDKSYFIGCGFYHRRRLASLLSTTN